MTTVFPSSAPDTSTPVPMSEVQRISFWEKAALLLDWADAPGGPSVAGKTWHTAHSLVPADVEAGTGPQIKWFEGGKLNVSYNCVDRHVAAGRGDTVALYFEGERGDRRTLTRIFHGGRVGLRVPG